MGLEPRTSYRKPQFTTNPHHALNDKVVIAMVGLPARGKSYVSKAVMRYLQFLGCPAQLFNAGNKRRDEGLAGTDANFFSASNEDGKAARERMAMECLDELLAWLQSTTRGGGCACGIFDATNTTRSRRQHVIERVQPHISPISRHVSRTYLATYLAHISPISPP